MKRFLFTQTLAAAGLALAAIAAVPAAHARSDVYFSAGDYQPRYQDDRARHDSPAWQRRGAYGDNGREGGGRRQSCGAQRWDPQVRYAPGEVVRRHGELYIARGTSARVWNVNSPPEWTPNYWAPARC